MSLEIRVAKERLDVLHKLLPESKPLDFEKLTNSELEVTYCLIMGADVEEIGKIRFISPHTVRNHLKSIYKKLEVDSARMLIIRYWRNTTNPPAPRSTAQLSLAFQKSA